MSTTDRRPSRRPVRRAAASLVLLLVVACAPSSETGDGGTQPDDEPPCPALGVDDDYVQVQLPSAVANLPVAAEPVEVELGVWADRTLPLLVGGEELLQVRVPTAVADEAESALAPGQSLRLRFWDRTGGAPRDEFYKEASIQLLTSDGQLVLEGGIQPIGTRYDPSHWGAEGTRCMTEDGVVGTDTRYALPAESDALPLREVVQRTVNGRTFTAYQGSSTVVSLGGEACSDCGVTPTSVIGFLSSD